MNPIARIAILTSGGDAPGMNAEDAHVSIVRLASMLTETERLLDGTSEVTQMRLHLLREVQGVLAL